MGGSEGSAKRFRLTKRYEENEDNIVLHNIKLLTCLIVKKITEIRNNVSVNMFLIEFKQEYMKLYN